MSVYSISQSSQLRQFSFILISRSEEYIDKGTSQFVVGSIHNTPNIFHFIKPSSLSCMGNDGTAPIALNLHLHHHKFTLTFIFL